MFRDWEIWDWALAGALAGVVVMFIGSVVLRYLYG